VKKLKNSIFGWILLVLGILLIGRKVNKKKLVEVSDKEVKKLFKEAFPKLVFPYIADYKYKIPTREALDEFLGWWKQWLEKKKIRYIAEFFDCDNFALLLSAMALLKGLHIPITNSETHSYNACIVHNEKREVYVIEPQTGEIFHPKAVEGDKKYETIFIYYT